MSTGGFDLALARGNGAYPPPTEIPDDNTEITASEGMVGGGDPAAPAPPDRDNAQRLIRWADPTQTLNIAKEILDDRESFPNGADLLGQIGQRVVREYEIDVQSRSDWMEKSKRAMELAMQVQQPKTNPWQDASNIIYPLLSSAALQFNARAWPAIVQGEDVVKGMVVGEDKGIPVPDPQTGQQAIDPQTQKPLWQKDSRGLEIDPGYKRRRGDRVGQHMSWQFTEEQPEWLPETDKLTLILPIVGCAFRKTYFDTNEARNVGALVRAEHLVINYRAKSMATAPRITEEMKLYPYEILEEESAGTYLHWEYGMADGALDGDEDAPHDFLEQHRRLDLDEDGYPEPYIVTVNKATAKVVRIVARWDPDGVKYSAVSNKIQRIEPVEYYTKYDFFPNPDGGIYGVGFGQLLNPINEAINTTLNQMFDAGTLQIMGGGFIGKGLSMQSGGLKFKLGEWKIVNALGSTVRDAIVPMVHAGPNSVMFTLLEFLVGAGKELAANAEVLTGNQSKANVPASTTMALIEQGLKIFTAIYKRFYLALKSELEKQFRLNRLYLNKQQNYRKGNEWLSISQEDYTEHTGVAPISDPSMVSDMQQLARAQFLMENFKEDPMVDGTEVRRRAMDAFHIQDIDKLLHVDPMQNPAMAIKMKMMGIQERAVKAQAIYHMARAYQALALGDKAVGDAHLNWLAQRYQVLQDDMDSFDDFTPPPQPGQPQKPKPLLTENPPLLPEDPPGVGQGRVSLAGA